MIDITIPPSALEAAARAFCLSQGYCWDRHPELHPVWVWEARACFNAIVKAWPGMYRVHYSADDMQHLILPLTEKTDD